MSRAKRAATRRHEEANRGLRAVPAPAADPLATKGFDGREPSAEEPVDGRDLLAAARIDGRSPLVALSGPDPSQAAKELDTLRSIVFGNEADGLTAGIRRADTKLASEMERVRAAIAELDHRLTSELDKLELEGGQQRKDLTLEIATISRDLVADLAERSDKIRSVAQSQFLELRGNLLDSGSLVGQLGILARNLTSEA